MAAKTRTRVYEIEELDEKAMDAGVIGHVKNFFLGRKRDIATVQHADHEFPHRIRIKEVSEGAEGTTYQKPIGERVRDWFLGPSRSEEDLKADACQATDRSKGSAASVTSRAKSAASDAVSTVSEYGSSISSAATDAAQAGAGYVKEGAESLRAKVSSPIAQVVNDAGAAYHTVTEKISRAAEDAEDHAEEAIRDARRRLQHDVKNFVAGNQIGSREGSLIDQAPLTALYTALGAMVLVWLMRRVWRQRVKSGVYLGDGTVEMIREATASNADDGTFVRESSVSPASLVSPPPSPLLDRRAGTPEPGIVTTQHTKVVYKRHSNLTKRQETAAEYAVVYVTMVLLSLFAESAGVARPLLHLAWFSWAVAQVIYASGIDATKDTHTVGAGREQGLYGTWLPMIALATPVLFESLHAAVRG